MYHSSFIETRAILNYLSLFSFRTSSTARKQNLFMCKQTFCINCNTFTIVSSVINFSSLEQQVLLILRWNWWQRRLRPHALPSHFGTRTTATSLDTQLYSPHTSGHGKLSPNILILIRIPLNRYLNKIQWANNLTNDDGTTPSPNCQPSTHRHPTTRLRTLGQAAEKNLAMTYWHGINWPETHNKQNCCQNNNFPLKIEDNF